MGGRTWVKVGTWVNMQSALPSYSDTWALVSDKAWACVSSSAWSCRSRAARRFCCFVLV